MPKNPSRYVLAILLVCPGALAAQETKWACTEELEYLRGTRAAHVELMQPAVLPGVGEVHIKMLGIRRVAVTRTEGLAVRWDWNDPDNNDSGSYRYAFIVEASGKGRYVDFDRGEKQGDGSVSAPPRQRYTCRRAASSPQSN